MDNGYIAKNFCGVILAAGRGERIKPLSFGYPKPLLPICNKPLMHYQIDIMATVGIQKCIIVVGHIKEKIVEYFGDGSRLGVKIEYVEQKEPMGIAHAIGQLEGYIDKPFLLFLGDIFLVPKNLSRVFETYKREKTTAVLVVKTEDNPDFIKRNYAVIKNDRGRVLQVIEKPRYITNNLKGCGIYLFDLPIFDAIRRTPRTAMRDEYEITTSIQILIDDGSPVYAENAVDWDMNVTYPCDLLECNFKWLRHTGAQRLIAQNARLHSGARIDNSIIGENVVVSNPILIQDSIILNNVNVDSKADILKSLVSPELIIHCNQSK